ncbi:MAG: GGDEF domain-containing protein [Synechococcaceae cyanobacterium SM2_3_1]|nr:GGDEF domain-containing protein [Synechococcaceae cyanobacterium SM2_3_1]
MTDEDDTTVIPEVAYLSAQQLQRTRPCLITLMGFEIGKLYPLRSSLIIGRGAAADLRLQGSGISREHCRILLKAEGVILEDRNSSNGTYLNGRRIWREVLTDGDKIQIGSSTVLRFTYCDELEERVARLLGDLALRDSLTNAYSKRYFMDRLDSEVHFSLRQQSCLSLLLFDLDNFKQINDRYGHLAGDWVLARFAERVQINIRNEDIFARYGGEEFVVLTRDTAGDLGLSLANRLRQQVENLILNYEGRLISLTTSIGLATMPLGGITSASHLIAAADQALYSAKAMGRNCVMVFNPEFHEMPVQA